MDKGLLTGLISIDLKLLIQLIIKFNKLSLNVAKTHSMLIAMKQRKKYLETSDQNLQPSIREENVVVWDTKYLGVQIEEYLTWKIEINQSMTRLPVKLASWNMPNIFFQRQL